jgi:hypothetical protein
MRIFIQLLIIAVLIAVFSSCTTTLYTSNTVNAPLLKHRGETQFTITKNDAQAAVAVTNHIGIIANGFYRNYERDNYKHFGQLVEAGVGKYRTMFGEHLVFENYLGLGYARVYKQQEFLNSNKEAIIGSFNTNGAKVFLQPSVGYASKFVDVAFTPRFSMVKYMNFTSENYTEDQLQQEHLANGELTRLPYFFMDPTLTIRIGYRYLKAQVQYGRIVNLGNFIEHPSDFSSIGIVFNLGGWRYADDMAKQQRQARTFSTPD